MSNAAKRAAARRTYMQQRNPYLGQPSDHSNADMFPASPQNQATGEVDPAGAYPEFFGYGQSDNLFDNDGYGYTGQVDYPEPDGYPSQYPEYATDDANYGYDGDAYGYAEQADAAAWEGYPSQYPDHTAGAYSMPEQQGYSDGYSEAAEYDDYGEYDDEEYDYDYDYDEQADEQDWDAYPSQQTGYTMGTTGNAGAYASSAQSGYTGNPGAPRYPGYTTGSSGLQPTSARRGYTGGYSHTGQAGYTGRLGGNTGVLRDLPRPKTPRQRRKKGSAGQKVAISVIALVLVATLVILLVQPDFIFRSIGGSNSASTLSPTSQSSSSSQVQQGYDKTAYALDAAALAGILLEESGDAGAEYVQDTLFIGDATIAALMNYSEATGITPQNSIGVSGLDITDATGTPCADFVGMESKTIPQAVKIMQPQRIVLCFGADGTGQTTEAFAQSYGALIDAILIEWPYADIIIAGIPPLTEHHNTAMTKTDQLNQALANLAKQGELKFLDWGQALREEETGFAEAQLMQANGQTIAFGGAQMLVNYTRTHSYITEDLRPRPIDTSWERQGATPPEDDSSVIDSSASSSAPASSSSQQQATTVKVFVGAAANGGLMVNGEVHSSVTLNLAPGASTGSIMAFGNPGYQFTGWKVSGGSLADTSSDTINYTVPQGATLGSSVSLIAQFEYIGVIVPRLLWYFLYDVAPSGYYEDWQVIVTAYPSDNNVPGTIISQTPEGGSTIASDSAKIIYVQVASQAVPNLAAYDYANSTSVGFWPVAQVYQNSALPADSYISQSPAAGTTATSVPTITVYISNGVPP